MKKTRKFFIFCIGLFFSVLAVFLMFNEKIDVSAGSASLPETSNSDYQEYVEKYTEFHLEKYGEGSNLTPTVNPIVIYGEDYIASQSSMGTTETGLQFIEKRLVTDVAEYAYSESAAGGKTSLTVHRSGRITYNFNVSEAGFYNIYLNYYTVNGFSSNAERTLKLNGDYPFSDCAGFSFSRVWQDAAVTKTVGGVDTVYNVTNVEKTDNSLSYKKLWRNDTNGNELKPQQVEIPNSKVCAPFKDSMGYVNEPFEFYLQPGVNTLEIGYIKDYFVIDSIEIRSVEKTVSYADYYQALLSEHGDVKDVGAYTRIEAEAATTKSSPTLYPITDRSSAATTPYSITKTYLNCVGGPNWKVLGDWIAWEFEVPVSGYYEVSMRAKQNTVRGMFSTRSVSIATKENGVLSEYETLFDEMNNMQVSYNNKWKNITLGGDKPYMFYFEAGKTYSLKLEVTLGDYAPLISRLEDSIDALTKIYRRIIAYTTTSPDVNRDYELTTKFADLFYGLDDKGAYTVKGEGEFNKILEELHAISNEIKDISGGGSDKTGVIDSVIVILEKMVNKPRTITKRLSTFSTQVSSLGSLLNELREAPLTIDYIEIHQPSVKLPKATEGFFKALWKSVAGFFASFFIDYSSISETGDETESDTTIEVWMTLGRDQANVVRNLIDTKFTGDNNYAVEHFGKNVNVELKLTGADVLLKATLAGIGPDVALNVDSGLPVNYALRNAVLDLTMFDDFWDCVYAIPDGTYAYDNSRSNIYMASSLRQFQFSPEGALDEWFDSEKYSSNELKEKISGIYALPEKQIFLMMFVRDDVMEELELDKMFVRGYDNMTWDDMLNLVSELQAQQLQFYLPINEVGATALNSVFVSLLYQYGGSLYTSNNMESGLKTEAAMNAFEFWTNLYTNYSFPTAASFVNRFRTGEMPIGISYYEMYNTLSVFAPELKGKWSFHLIPGTGTGVIGTDGYEIIDHTATASGTGAVLMKQEVLTNGQINETGKAAWTFLKWWTNADTQAQFGREMEGILGSAARHATANVKALQELAWPQEDLDMLLLQWSQVHEMPQIAGSYITGREMENAFRAVINNFYNARETLFEYAGLIDDEINRKRTEFNLPLLADQNN